ncbi:MAG TPA: threonine/serine exporter family protein [Sunxiuqinia sp.]|nr:threonine/serine exporter family protein [Sunxiuqinia sp.]
MELLAFFEKWIWFGAAAVGFAILFNVPQRTIWLIFLMGALGGALKVLTMTLGGSIILGSFLGAMLVGFISIGAAHFRHSPPFVFSIPAVIPMVPGAFAYRTMLGIIKLTGSVDNGIFVKTMEATVNNGLKAGFVLMALAFGVSAPMLFSRRQSAKEIKVPLKLMS